MIKLILRFLLDYCKWDQQYLITISGRHSNRFGCLMVHYFGTVLGEILTPICDGPVEEVEELAAVHVVHQWWLLHEHDIALACFSL